MRAAFGSLAAELYVFQRTPSSIDLRNNQPTDPDWLASQKPGWHEARRRNFESLMAGVPVKQDLVNDGWTEAFRLLFGTVRDKAPSKLRMACWALLAVGSRDFYRKGAKKYLTEKAMRHMQFDREMELADFRKMESIRARVDRLVDDMIRPRRLNPIIVSSANARVFTMSICRRSTVPMSHLLIQVDAASMKSTPRVLYWTVKHTKSTALFSRRALKWEPIIRVARVIRYTGSAGSPSRKNGLTALPLFTACM